jgi:hypothetical protein
MGLTKKNCGAAFAPIAPAPNPDPSRFEITHIENFGTCVLAVVSYLDCTNFEGVKVLLYVNTTIPEVRNQGALDPHFSETGLSPFARFKPTEDGLRVAKELARLLGASR